ncbi:unnamed protein product [Effrenium voratum]|uniref:Uncharacterized protein n=1 Tax=Effrenium voratum TaxID=2562239 RepID=A0AA36JL14_9DINO|nr:unnamed protein product [Effrenium voratum]
MAIGTAVTCDRRQARRGYRDQGEDTWARHCHGALFWDEHQEDIAGYDAQAAQLEPAMGFRPKPAGLTNRWLRTRRMWRHIARQAENYDWFLAFDDGGFPIVENIQRLVSSLPSEPLVLSDQNRAAAFGSLMNRAALLDLQAALDEETACPQPTEKKPLERLQACATLWRCRSDRAASLAWDAEPELRQLLGCQGQAESVLNLKSSSQRDVCRYAVFAFMVPDASWMADIHEAIYGSGDPSGAEKEKNGAGGRRQLEADPMTVETTAGSPDLTSGLVFFKALTLEEQGPFTQKRRHGADWVPEGSDLKASMTSKVRRALLVKGWEGESLQQMSDAEDIKLAEEHRRQRAAASMQLPVDEAAEVQRALVESLQEALEKAHGSWGPGLCVALCFVDAAGAIVAAAVVAIAVALATVEILASEEGLFVSHPNSPSWLANMPAHAKDVFCVNMFCLDQAFQTQALDFLLPAFSLFPEKDYCIVTQPHTAHNTPLLNAFSIVPPQPQNTFGHVLYLIHRASLMGPPKVTYLKPHLLEQLDPLLEIFESRQEIVAQCKRFLQEWRKWGERSASEMEVFVVEFDSQAVGLIVLQLPSPDAVERLRCCYHLDDYLLVEHHETGGFANKGHVRLLHWALNPLFQKYTRRLLQGALRICGKTALFAKSPAESVKTSDAFEWS